MLSNMSYSPPPDTYSGDVINYTLLYFVFALLVRLAIGPRLLLLVRGHGIMNGGAFFTLV